MGPDQQRSSGPPRPAPHVPHLTDMWGRRRVVPHLSVGCGCDWSASAGASCTPTGGGQRSEISGGQFGQFAATGGVLKITQGGRDLGRPFPGWVGGRKRGPSDAGRWLRRIRLFNAHSVRPHSPRPLHPPLDLSLDRRRSDRVVGSSQLVRKISSTLS